MTSETFDSLCNQIYWQLYNRLERKDDPNLRFATNGTAERVFHAEVLIQFFQCLPVADQTVVQQFGLPEESLTARLDERKLHSFLAVLLFASCGIEAARVFTRKLVATNEWPLIGNTSGKRIEVLPASSLDLLDIFQDAVIVDKFCSNQACFSTVTIWNRGETKLESLALERLPYLEEKEIGSGSFGKVFRVKIAQGHFKDQRHGASNDAPMEVARKDYTTTNEFHDAERKIMEQIFSGNRECANILRPYGSLCIGESAYSLFMPYALCDLRAFMMEYHPTKPKTILEKTEIVLSAQGIAEGLDFLHNQMTNAENEDIVCYHMDLKPSNILVFPDAAYEGGTRYVWKLSDFGMARIKVRKRAQSSEEDIHKSLLHRSPSEQSLSGTVNRRGEGTYMPPESLKRTAAMTASSDVWALGCIFSVVFAFLEDGSEGVKYYQTRRLRHSESDGYDRFFLRGRYFKASKEHPEIHRWHRHLIKKAARRQSEEGNAVRYILTYLEEKVLVVDNKKRDNVKILKQRLTETYFLFKTIPPVERRSVDDGNSYPKWIGKILPVRPRNYRIGPRINLQIDLWQLSEAEELKGCKISPKGTLVAYWSDTKIKLYNELSLPSQTIFEEPRHLDPAAEYTLNLADCVLKSVALSERYMIASTKGSSFQCYIYDLALNRQYHITLQLPEIVTLAISANGKTLACAVQSKEEGQDCALIYLVSIVDLIRGSSSPSQFDTTTLSTDWPATDITYISFPTPDEVYLIVERQIPGKSREKAISVIYLSLKARPRQMRTLIIQSGGVDPGNTVGSFTAFRQQPATCAFVTQQNQLQIHNLNNTGDNDISKPIQNYRILKLVMDLDDQKMFALGTQSENNRVHLLEVKPPQSENDRITVKELLLLPDLSQDDEFTQVLSYDPKRKGEKYILIATLSTACIYRILLPDPLTRD